MKHTPGPWKWSKAKNLVSEANDSKVGHRVVIYRKDCYVQNEADSLLIAAAPDLLAACEHILAWLDENTMPYGLRDGLYPRSWVLEKVIAKAKDEIKWPRLEFPWREE